MLEPPTTPEANGKYGSSARSIPHSPYLISSSGLDEWITRAGASTKSWRTSLFSQSPATDSLESVNDFEVGETYGQIIREKWNGQEVISVMACGSGMVAATFVVATDLSADLPILNDQCRPHSAKSTTAEFDRRYWTH